MFEVIRSCKVVKPCYLLVENRQYRHMTTTIGSFPFSDKLDLKTSRWEQLHWWKKNNISSDCQESDTIGVIHLNIAAKY